MPPIPIYAHSPINAATKPDGVSPHTADRPFTTDPSASPPVTTQTENRPYQAAQPGAPALPVPTGASPINQQYAPRTPQPTRTQPLGSQGPPPPQPNAFPSPFGTGPPQATPTSLPPPPKAGESRRSSTQPTQTSPTPSAYYPPQMSIPAPPAAFTQSAQRGTTIAFGHARHMSSEHPPGYQQDPTAGELTRYQRAAQEALEEEQLARRPSLSEEAAGVVDGVWGSVKGVVTAAGEKIAAAEEEVWKRINKDS